MNEQYVTLLRLSQYMGKIVMLATQSKFLVNSEAQELVVHMVVHTIIYWWSMVVNLINDWWNWSSLLAVSPISHGTPKWPYAIGNVFFLKFGGCFLNLRRVISENTVVEILLVNSDS